MKVVIIEGTDNVGKDTLINEVSEQFEDTIICHCEKPKSMNSWEQAEEQEEEFSKLLGRTCYEYEKNINNSDIVFIHNRSWYGEYVYGCMYRDNNPEDVIRMVQNLDACINKSIDSKDVCLITLLSDNVDFLVRNDDGLSISKANRDKIAEETKRFEEITNCSLIENKHIVYVNNGDKFRPKEDILNEVMKYIEG